MDFTFLTAKGNVAFFRSDAEQAEWTQEEFSLLCTFPYNKKKEIERGMIVLFQDPATKDWQAYEIRNCSSFGEEGYQQFTAEDLAIAELTDCHIPEKIEFTDVTASSAISQVLKDTGWSVGTNEVSALSSGDIGRGSVWQAVCDIRTNWNVCILPRVTVNSSGISKRYIDIFSAEGTWRGLRLAVNKNFSDPCVTYDDSELYTALYAYGASYTEGEGDKRKTLETTIADAVWSKTSQHPAKPKGQKYIEDPTKTALYGRNGKPRYGYYQNGNIKDPKILLQKAWESLKNCFEPKISITGTLIDLKRFGYADQPVRLYDLAIVEIESLGVQFYKQIIQLTVDLLDPSKTVPNIGSYIPNIIYINRETEDTATGGGSGRGGGTRSTKKQGEFETNILQNERDIDLNARQINEAGDILRQAGLKIDPITGVLIYADDNENMVGSKFNATANAIESEVEDRAKADEGFKSSIRQLSNSISLVVDSKSGKIKSASIILAINSDGSTASISADHIDIDGVVKALQSQDISCGSLTVQSYAEFYKTVEIGQGISFDSGAFLDISENKLKVGEYNAKWLSASYKTFVLSATHNFVYGNSYVTGQIITGSIDHTIHYLGRS